jgi:multiple sugar transport system permease protein
MRFSSSSSLSPQTDLLVKEEGERQGSQQHLWRRNLRTAFIFWCFVGPLLLGLLVFFFIPIIWSVVLSLSSARSTLTPQGFVGLDNYEAMLADPNFRQALGTFLVFAIFIVPLTFICALALALLVNSVRFAQGFFRLVFFLPAACSYVLASVIWKVSIFNGTFYGLANHILALFHVAPLQWIFTANPPWYWLVLVTVRLWLQLGLYMIIFLAGLQEIPAELYEAATVDGARRGWQTFRYITFPRLRNASIAILLLNIIAAFQAFDEFFNIMSNGNSILARPPLVYIYQVALIDGNFGYGSAGAIVLMLIIVCFTLLQARILGFGQAE